MNIRDKVTVLRKSDYTQQWFDTKSKGIIVSISTTKATNQSDFALVTFKEKDNFFYSELIPIESAGIKLQLA